MPAQNAPDINAIVAAWSTFAAALVALGAILFELIKGASARRRHIRDRLEKQENVRNMIAFLMTPIKLEYYQLLFLENRRYPKVIPKGPNEDALLTGMHEIYAQAVVLSSNEVEEINQLIHILESVQALRPQMNVVGIPVSNARALYLQIKKVAQAMGKKMSKFDDEPE